MIVGPATVERRVALLVPGETDDELLSATVPAGATEVSLASDKLLRGGPCSLEPYSVSGSAQAAEPKRSGVRYLQLQRVDLPAE